ncbi:hypothetical protein EKH57_15620 [Halorubrum sp. BOL3-1]|uniref:hypothetical protein n=1 Tax=Halorubrum sp. BOL3-1 TaxID=2497325 RepID=UPI0010050A85|nr:hypothetical protein [Halorubrum sp. BOL3-1]QAU14017.1 hypothetical protein EKH57_15620 [Halorubrum sp. BOL3-1]
MSLPKTFVHVLAPRSGALSAFLDDVESSFIEYDLAPDVGRPRAISEADAAESAQQSPREASEDGWLPYLTADALDELDVDASGEVHYFGVAGMRVVGRVLRETTGIHPSIVLQSQTHNGTPDTYAVYRYDEAADEFARIARGSHA